MTGWGKVVNYLSSLKAASVADDQENRIAVEVNAVRGAARAL